MDIPRKKIGCKDIDYKKYLYIPSKERESEDLMNREMGNPAPRSMNGEMYSAIKGEWVLFEVNVVDKESLKILIDEKVIAKNREHAKGLTGVYDVLEDKNFDDTKLKIIVEYIASIRPIKEDE